MKSLIFKHLAAALAALTLTTVSAMAADVFLIASYHETDAAVSRNTRPRWMP
ncbi:MAG: hypothetical protein MZV65_35170 [Chromatiales bacterium]|nr:hypothetical protein [Chromatiales bacterium]